MKQSYRCGIEAAERTRRECERGQEVLNAALRSDRIDLWAARGYCRWTWTNEGRCVVVGAEYFATGYPKIDELTFARIALAIEAGQENHSVPIPPTSPGPDGTVWNDSGILRLVGGGQDDG